LLRLLQPGLRKAAIVLREQAPENARYIGEAMRAGQRLSLEVQALVIGNVDELDRALDAASDVRALVVVGDAQFTIARMRIAELALKRRLPTMFTHSAMVEAGGLMSYGPDYNNLYRQVAVQVFKILNGAKPGDIPVEQPTRYEQVVNLKTAKALDLTIPPMLLASMTNAIE
jgi:putative ABC transport system substrate-binding protein